MKKWALLLALLMLVLIPVSKPAAAVDSSDWTYELLDDGSAEITGYKGKETNLIFPETLDGHPVTSIGDYAFYECGNLTNVTLPSSLTSIGNAAFCNCENLTSVTLPKSLVTIGSSAFSGTALSSVEIPEGVTTIGEWVFYYCENLTSVTLPSTLTSIGNTAFRYTGLTEIEIPEGVTTIGNGAFQFCENLTNVTLPSTLTSIGEGAFRYTGLTSVEIPEGVTTIGSSAFSDCENLTNVTLPNTLTSIGNAAFSHAGLTEIVIPEGVTTIGDGAFYYCENLTSVTLPSALTSIGEDAFCYTGLTSVEIPEGVTTIGDYAFAACENVTSVTLPSSLTSIGNAAFLVTGLTSVEIPEGVTTIGEWAFSDCENLTSVTLPSTLTSIGNAAFRGTGLTEIVIPEGVTTIGSSAFSGCENLTIVTLPNSLTAVGANPFGACPNLETIEVSADHPVFEVVDGALINKDEHSLIAYPAGLTAASYTVPEGVTTIGDWAFSGCGNLTSVTLPSALTSIGEDAFRYTGLTSVEIPEGVTTIGSRAFSGCANLTSVSLPNSLTAVGANSFGDCPNLETIEVSADHPVFEVVDGALINKDEHSLIAYPAGLTAASYTVPEGVTTIGDSAFEYCENLTSVSLPNSLTTIGYSAFRGTGLTNVVIPEGVTSIGWYAFSRTGLTSVEIPESVTSIDEWAFENCEDLTSVSLSNSLTSIGDDAFADCKNLTSVSVIPGSYAESWAQENGLECVYPKFNPEDLRYKLLNETDIEITGYDGEAADVIIPDTIDEHTVVSIGEDAFRDNKTIESVQLADTITRIENQAFNGCENLSSVTLPANLETIEVGAFQQNPNLTSITFPDSLTSIEAFAFNETGLTSVTLPDGIETIGRNPFMGCNSLVSFEISPENPKFEIIDNALYNKETKTLLAYPGGLSDQTYEIPDGTLIIGHGAFYKNTALTNVMIPESVTTIDNFAFRQSALTDIVIPEGVATINESAFYGCENLTSVSLPDSLTSIDDDAFRGTALTSVNVVPGSYAESWAKKKGLECVYSETTETIILTETLTVPQMIEPTATRTYHEAGSAEIFILYYYDIANGTEDDPYYRWESDAYVPSIEFEQQVRMLYELGYTSITLSQMVDELRNGGELPERPVMFTFDSTELGQWKNAYPILKKYGFVGNLMIRAYHVDAHNSLSKEQIETMMDDGWEIGSAGYYGYDLADLSVIGQEIGRSKPALEEMFDVDIEVFAYQDGYTDSEGRIISRTVQSGYLAALAGDLRSTEIKLSKNMYYIPRYLIRKGVTYNEFLDMLPWKEGTISRETMEWTTLAP